MSGNSRVVGLLVKKGRNMKKHLVIIIGLFSGFAQASVSGRRELSSGWSFVTTDQFRLQLTLNAAREALSTAVSEQHREHLRAVIASLEKKMAKKKVSLLVD